MSDVIAGLVPPAGPKPLRRGGGRPSTFLAAAGKRGCLGHDRAWRLETPSFRGDRSALSPESRGRRKACCAKPRSSGFARFTSAPERRGKYPHFVISQSAPHSCPRGRASNTPRRLRVSQSSPEYRVTRLRGWRRILMGVHSLLRGLAKASTTSASSFSTVWTTS